MHGPEILIHEDAFVHNFRTLRELSGGRALMPVIKADAYGHSAELIAKICESRFPESEAPCFVVARASEARDLRARGVRRRLLVLSEFSEEDFLAGWPRDTELVLNEPADLARLEAWQAKGLKGVQLNVDTGMNRLGFRPGPDCVPQLLAAAAQARRLGLTVTGLMSHLACGEEAPGRASAAQERDFAHIVTELRAAWRPETHGSFPAWIHLANSPGAALGVGQGGCNAVRPGILLWGASPGGDWAHGKRFRPVAEVRAPIRQLFWVEAEQGLGYGHRFRTVRRSLIGTVALGYADGVRRSLSRAQGESSKLGFMVEDARVPVAGTVSMDLTMVDLTDHPRAAEWGARVSRGEAPELWAAWIHPRQTADEIAAACGTIPYEILCEMSRRLPRRRVGGTA